MAHLEDFALASESYCITALPAPRWQVSERVGSGGCDFVLSLWTQSGHPGTISHQVAANPVGRSEDYFGLLWVTAASCTNL